MLFSMKMRASKKVLGKDEHISGAERILEETSLEDSASLLIKRAISHTKGKPDFIQLKVEQLAEEKILHVNALAVSTAKTTSPEECYAFLVQKLLELDIVRGKEIVDLLLHTKSMRGAILLDVDSLVRLENDHERGVRVTYMDSRENFFPKDSKKNHFHEALVLATKVVNAPNIIGEICISDDPDYQTGYIASLRFGYVRLPKIKPLNYPYGGRIFLYRGKHLEVEKTIDFLEKMPVLVENIPPAPECAKEKVDANSYRNIYDKVATLKEKSLYRTLRTLHSPEGAFVVVEGKEKLLLASNSYLDLTFNNEVKEETTLAIKHYGTSSGGSRLTTGNFYLHEELEHDLSLFKGTEATLLFNTGYMANVGIISALFKNEKAVIFSDELNHASIIDGCKLSGQKIVVYKHNDMEDLEEKICLHAPKAGLILSDAVFSMEGDIANLPKIIALSKKYSLFSMIDEAHALGVIGKTGRGITEYFEDKYLLLAKEELTPDIYMGTLSKALASEGGFACGKKILIDYLRNTARSFIFSTALTPASVASARASLKILLKNPSLVTKLQENTRFFCHALETYGIVTKSDSAIVPILIGDEKRAQEISAWLFNEGIFLSAIRYPTVRRGKAILRVALMASHSHEDLLFAAKKIAEGLARFKNV